MRALLEAVECIDIGKQKGQVEDLDRPGVMLELGQRRRQQLYVSEQQRFHFLAVTKQRGVRIDLDLDLPRQTFLGQFLEHQRALPLGRVLGDNVGKLDADGVGSARKTCE